MVIFQLRKYNLLYTHQIGIIKTAAATISISAIYILYMFFTSQNSNLSVCSSYHAASIYTRTVPADITAGTKTVLRRHTFCAALLCVVSYFFPR